MKNLYIPLIIIAIAFTSCQKKINPFLVSKQNIGLLTDSTKVKDLETIYINDSIVKYIAGDEFTGTVNDILIYDKSGSKLLALSPSQALDSSATISTIKIYDARYKTEKGITNKSTFEDIKANYTITDIQNTFLNVIISVKEHSAYFTIDKKDLPGELRIDYTKKIEVIQIPDNAKIKYFTVGW